MLYSQIQTAVQELTGDMPLVLHGGTGIPEDMIKKAISLGVAKGHSLLLTDIYQLTCLCHIFLNRVMRAVKHYRREACLHTL